MDLEDELRPRRRPEQRPSQFRRISEVIVVVAVVVVIGSSGAVVDVVDAVRRRVDAGEGSEARRQREKL